MSFCVNGKKENYIVELKWGINSHFMEDQSIRERVGEFPRRENMFNLYSQ